MRIWRLDEKARCMPWLNLHMKSQREKGFFSLKILLFFLQYEQRCMEEFCVQMALTLQPILAIFNMHAKPSSLDHASWRRQYLLFASFFGEPTCSETLRFEQLHLTLSRSPYTELSTTGKAVSKKCISHFFPPFSLSL